MPKAKMRKRCATRAVISVEPLEDRTLFSFGLTASGASFVVDTGAQLTFTVLRTGTSSTVHSGDLTSVKYNGAEMLAPYSSTFRYSHYEQGLGNSTTVVSAAVDPSNNWIMITCDDSTDSTGGVIHYYIARKGENNIYMASTPTDVNNGPGEGRFIAYLNRSVFTKIEDPSDISTTNATVEGSDVFYNNTTGITKSKFYNTRQMIDNPYHGVTGANVGAWIFMGNRETSSGGPFFRDIDFQTTSAATEMYNCLFTGHEQTQAYRQGLKGPYAMQFTNGSAPVTPDYSFMAGLGINGWVAASGRGTLAGTASGVPAGHRVTVALANSTAQYWATPDATTGRYAISGALPGIYVETLYQDELAVGTQTVTIAAGSPTAANIQDTLYTPQALWTIGSWDGTPRGFLNADKIETMHPSDVRMAPWNNVTYTIGTTPESSWPLEQWKDVNNNNQINFNLTAAQASTPLTLRIGISLAQFGARPQIAVNTGQTDAWSSSLPAPSNQPNSRGITRGAWRGNETNFTYNIPISALHIGNNTIDISVNSGTTGTGFLSPGITYDAIDLVPTSSLTNAPVLTRVAVSPTNPTMALNSTRAFTATGFDQFNNPMPVNVIWSASSGAIDGTGLYTAGGTAGTATVTAANGSVSGQSTLTIANSAPTIATAASASPNPIPGTRTNLSVLGADDGGESKLTYSWSLTGTPPAAVTYSANGTNAAKITTATFVRAGSYTFLVTITDPGGLSTASTVGVTVSQTAAGVIVTPATTALAPGGTQNFTASAVDQFGNAIAATPAFTWSVTGSGNTITSTGTTTAALTLGSTPGTFTVTATSAGIGGTATVTVASAPSLVSAQVGDGASQRSSVSSFTLTFAAPVSFTAASFTLEQSQDDTTWSDVSAGMSVSNPSGDGATWVISCVAGGALDRTAAFATPKGLLVNGIYRVTLHGAAITPAAGGPPLDGGADQVVGFASNNANAVNGKARAFHVLFGDVNGDGVVNGYDSGKFKQVFAGTSGYNPDFDFQGDGVVNGFDSGKFKQVFNVNDYIYS